MTTAGEPWQRLDVRLVYQALIRVALSLPLGVVGVTVGDDPVWPLVAGSCAGVLGALSTLVTWRTTRFRITGEQVEMHTGWLARRHRIVARDRIRTVDVSARLLQRVLRLRTVHIGSGDPGASFDLNGLRERQAAGLQLELMPGATPDRDPGEGTAIARFRHAWIPLNVISPWSVFAVAGPVFALHWALRPFGVDLFGAARGLLGGPLPGWAVAVALVVAYLAGTAVRAGAFIVENWGFTLLRDGGALVTRRGLLTTRTVQRADRRIRGIALDEPLLWRWLQLTRTRVLSTGQGAGGEAAVSDILPRTRLAEARELAPRILPDGARPLEAVLRRHPRGALTRRLGLALYGPALASGAGLLFTLSGAIPGRWWLLPLALIPVTVPLAVVAYRSLGHTVSGDYVVVRTGVFHRRTVALQRRAVIGWTASQSIFQRWGGRMTVGIPTGAGARHYEAPDMSVRQAVTFLTETAGALGPESP
ncbi:PH domain-containing protein [Actinoplanes xinjiangensis]|uniref:Putative membrane protein n=1 Tax=Actinoplanes xinjiangensis TaxID=512350 RepID=A0A316FF82_9ACTN|nr:PH domain-containing protein [Actinoplanes xinjiangensis]PWK47558.1 putative membrane protein [Actinoplanes xinjiangensis]